MQEGGESMMYLISEYCAHEIYIGWHLYLRDNKDRQKRNADGHWGWLARNHYMATTAHRFLRTLGISMVGDGTCDNDGYAEMARRFPIPSQRIGGKPRGCIAVEIKANGEFVKLERK